MIRARSMRAAIEPGLFPLILALFLIIMGLLWEPLGLPDVPRTIAIVSGLFEKHGATALFLGAFIEGLFMINLYFPGSFVILLAILVSGRTLPELALVAFIAWLAFSMASVVNYLLGKYGFYRLLLFLGSKDVVGKMQGWMHKRGKMTVFLSAVHPNFLAVALVSMGIAQKGLVKSTGLSMIALACWAPVLTALTAFVLPPATEAAGYYWFMVALLLAWALALCIRASLAKRTPVVF